VIEGPVGRSGTDVHVPDGEEMPGALARATDLGVGAHQDDLEFGYPVPIAECRDDPDRWFVGVTCTDGAGSARGGAYADHSDDQMAEVRRLEQRRAADIGKYAAVVQLGHPSSDIKSAAGVRGLADELASILDVARPVNLYTHNPADKHDTHVAVAMATVLAVRRLPVEVRPSRFVGVEGWRDLDWLGDGEQVRMDATPHVDLIAQFDDVFSSQIDGAKRYDVAMQGRRRANATLHSIRQVDDAREVIVAIDLTPLSRNDDLDPIGYTLAAIDRFRADVEQRLGRLLG
jgi:LmbE family N-acetylglucosaminyl deacetylase